MDAAGPPDVCVCSGNCVATPGKRPRKWVMQLKLATPEATHKGKKSSLQGGGGCSSVSQRGWGLGDAANTLLDGHIFSIQESAKLDDEKHEHGTGYSNAEYVAEAASHS